jgi:mono/diheme cytochrome c family protein
LALTALGLATMLWASGCGQGESPPPAASSGPPASTPVAPPTPGATPPGDGEKGRQVYLGHCVACHNRDPAKDGPLGPAVKGSPAELVEARVLRAAYPPGYVPKRPSKVMPARPDLSASVGDLAAYLR